MSLEKVIKLPDHLFSKQPFPLIFFSIVYYVDIFYILFIGPIKVIPAFFFLIDFSHFPSVPICLKLPSHSHWCCWFFFICLQVSFLFGSLPDLGKLSWAALNPVTVRWLKPFFTGWSLTFAYWSWNQTWVRAVRGSGFILFSNIWNIKAHCTLCKKSFLLFSGCKSIS